MKTISRSKLVKDLDSAFSQYVRLVDTVDGMTTCVTCGDVKPWKQMQAGHFYTRGRYPTRWDEDNVHPQCYRCNIIYKGNYIHYTKYMIDFYGRDWVDDLEKRSLSGDKIPTPDIRTLTDYYKKEVVNMLY